MNSLLWIPTNTPPSLIDRQKLNRSAELNRHFINLMYLIYLQTISPNIKEDTFSVLRELSSKLTIYLYTKQVPTFTRKFKY